MAENKEEKRLLKVTPEEFERLCKGEVVSLLLEDNISHSCLESDKDGRRIVVEDIEVDGEISLKGKYNYQIGIGLNTRINKVTVSDRAVLADVALYDNAQIGSLKSKGQSRIRSIQITDKVRTGNLEFIDESDVGHIYIQGQAKVGNILVESQAEVYAVSFSDDSDGRDLKIYDRAILNYIRIENSARINGLSVTGRPYIGEFEFYGGEIKNEIVFKDLNVQHLYFTGVNTGMPHEFHIKDSLINQLRFVDLRALTNLVLTNVKPKSSDQDTFLEITRSSFRKLELVGNDLDQYFFTVFENSDITNAFIADTYFSKIVKKRVVDINVRKTVFEEDIRQAKLFFEQVKTIFQKQGNRTDALKYQALELNAQYGLISLWNPETTLDKITLWFGKWSSNFGTSWLRGTSFLFAASAFMYFILLWIAVGWPNFFTSDHWSEVIRNYPDFINPTTNIWTKWQYLINLEGGKEELVGFWVKLWLYFSKFVIVAIIYQIVQAFRKFGRK